MTLAVPACCPRCDKRFPATVNAEVLNNLDELKELREQLKGLRELKDANDADARRIWELLATREREILANFLQGMANSEIAKYLRTTEQVIKNYFSSIFEKTGMGSRLELLLFIVDRPLLRAELNNLFEQMQNGTVEFGTTPKRRKLQAVYA